MAEQGVVLSHATIMRWVLRFVPEHERRWSRFARSPGSSWRLDETAVSVRGSQAFFCAAVSQDGVPWPVKINADGNSATHRGLRLLGDEDRRWQCVQVRARRYLNNVIEQTPELSGPPSAGARPSAHRGIGAISAKDLRRWRPVSGRQA